MRASHAHWGVFSLKCHMNLLCKPCWIIKDAWEKKTSLWILMAQSSRWWFPLLTSAVAWKIQNMQTFPSSTARRNCADFSFRNLICGNKKNAELWFPTNNRRRENKEARKTPAREKKSSLMRYVNATVNSCNCSFCLEAIKHARETEWKELCK